MSPELPEAVADPRLKLCVAFGALGIALAAKGTAPALLFAGCALAALMVAGPRRAPWRALFGAWALGAAAALLRALCTPGASLVALPLAGGRLLVLSRAGVAEGSLVISRVLAATLTVSWLTVSTSFPQLVLALAWVGVPKPLLDILLLAHRQRHALGDSLDTVRCAQAMRLGYGGWRQGIRSAGTLVGAVACRALDQAAATAEAMEIRGDEGLATLVVSRGCPTENVRVAVFGALALLAGATLAWGVPL